MIDRESLEMIAQIIAQKLEANNAKLEARLEASMDLKLNVMEERLNDRISLTEATLNDSIAELTGRVIRVENGLRDVNLTLETKILPDIKLLTEVFVPAAKRMEKVTSEFEHMQTSIQVLNLTVTNHSKQLAQIC